MLCMQVTLHVAYTRQRPGVAVLLPTYSNGFEMTSSEFDFKIQHRLPASNQTPSLDSIWCTHCTYVW